MRIFSISTLFIILNFSPLLAHEFWIDPVKFQINSKENIAAHFRVGTNFKAPSSSYLEQHANRHEFAAGGKVLPLPALSGDRPAMQLRNAPDGLVVLIHETKNSSLTYDSWEKFMAFLESKNFDGVVANHLARGLPDKGFEETYRRYAKALVAVGDGAGQDFETGLKIEIVALKNPYTDDISAGLPVQVLLDGAPRVGVQVEVFEKPADDLGSEASNITTYTTDAAGTVTLPVTPGHVYLVDNVAMLPVDEPGNPAVWHSIWASLTFAVP